MTDKSKAGPPGRVLAEISTSWRQVGDPLKFVMTYGPAVRRYLLAILRDEHEADEVLQELLVRVTERGLGGADPARGRFRDYLRAVVRNAAFLHLRRRARRRAGEADLDRLAADPGPDAWWAAEWRRCVLEKAWRGLERHQRAAKGNLCHTVLRLTADHPDEDSDRLAARAARLSGRPLTPEAFRKQLSRARRLFAGLIVAEVSRTLDDPTPEHVREELADLGLLESLRDYLPGPG